MTIYLLDRNIVVDIEQHLLNGKEGPELQRARDVDVEGHIISPLLAVIEGKFGHLQSREDMTETLVKESKLLADFFENADTDADFLDDQAVAFVDAFVKQGAKDFQKYSSLVRAYLGRLGRTPTRREGFDLMHWVLTEARREHVEVAHPAVLAAIGCIFGNVDARKLLKPKAGPELVTEKGVYGALSDLLHISWLNRIRADLGPDMQFLTRDQYLEGFMRVMELNVARMHLDFRRSEETTSTDVKLDWKLLLPDLAKVEDQVAKAQNLFIRHYVAQSRGLAPFTHRGWQLQQELRMAWAAGKP